MTPDTRTAAEIAGALASGDTTSVEVTQAHLDRIAEQPLGARKVAAVDVGVREPDLAAHLFERVAGLGRRRRCALEVADREFQLSVLGVRLAQCPDQPW